MSGPNSAPNGEVGLIKGHWNEEFVFISDRDFYRGEYGPFWVSLQDYLAQSNRLRTGKTK